jgi:hypothetical protein
MALPIRDMGRIRVRRLTRVFAVAASAGALAVAGLLAFHTPAKAAAGDPASHRTNSGTASSPGRGLPASRKAERSSSRHRSAPGTAQTPTSSTESTGSGVSGSSGQPHATSGGS